MKSFRLILSSVAILSSSAYAAAQTGEPQKAPEITSAAVTAPKTGDWSTVVSKTPEGGFVMGNPKAKVKLVEFGSMTCGHCAEFEKQGGAALVDNYVKKGLVSWEFRNFVLNPFDLSASLLARCGGEAGFFGTTRTLFAEQENWIAKFQAADPAQLQALQSMPAVQQYSTIAELGGLKQYAAMRGVPQTKADQCLADEAEIDRLMQMNADAAAAYNIPGTPSFLINGSLVDHIHSWEMLEPKIKEALAS